MDQHVFSQEFSREYAEDGPGVRQQYAQPQPGPAFAQPVPMQQVGVAAQPVYQAATMVPVVQVLTTPTSAMASASLVLGLLTPVLLFLSMVTAVGATYSYSVSRLSFALTDAASLLCALLAVVFGHIALQGINHSAGRLKGTGMAVIGLVIGYLGILPAILFMLMVIVAR